MEAGLALQRERKYLKMPTKMDKLPHYSASYLNVFWYVIAIFRSLVTRVDRVVSSEVGVSSGEKTGRERRCWRAGWEARENRRLSTD